MPLDVCEVQKRVQKAVWKCKLRELSMHDASELLFTVQQSVITLIASYRNALERKSDHLVLVINKPSRSFRLYQEVIAQTADACIESLTKCIHNPASKETEISDWYNLVSRLLLFCEMVLPADAMSALRKQLDEAGRTDKEVTDLVCADSMQLMQTQLTKESILETQLYAQQHPYSVVRAKDLFVSTAL